MEFKRPEIWIGVLIVAVIGLSTLVLQIKGVVNILASISELYLFGIALPALGFALALIWKGVSKKQSEPSGQTGIPENEKSSGSIGLEVLTRGELEQKYPFESLVSRAREGGRS